MTDASQILVFDRALVRRRRTRAAPCFNNHKALLDASADMLMERIDDVTRNFTTILDLGAHDGALAQRLRKDDKLVISADLSEAMLRLKDGPAVAMDEEFLPFAENSFDLIVSNLSLHWINDLPGAFVQIKRALRPGGLFLAALPGGETLRELRQALLKAELEVNGGISPRLSPTISLLTASHLMQRAGFDLPVVDHELCQLAYPDMLALMQDLRGMGETNAHRQRLKNLTARQLFAAAAAAYELDRTGANNIIASFDIVFLHGWKS
jgi:SAM-dependent methyltransferase